MSFESQKRNTEGRNREENIDSKLNDLADRIFEVASIRVLRNSRADETVASHKPELEDEGRKLIASVEGRYLALLNTLA